MEEGRVSEEFEVFILISFGITKPLRQAPLSAYSTPQEVNVRKTRTRKEERRFRFDLKLDFSRDYKFENDGKDFSFVAFHCPLCSSAECAFERKTISRRSTVRFF